MKTCPFCAEEIQDAALVCKHCGRDLRSGQTGVIGRIQRVPLREVWKHEALDFTRWLQENLDVLNSELDLNLTSAEREQSAGDFSVDLIAKDEGGNPVVIENQLDKSNHDHLGKLITYLVAVGAKTAIWVVSDPRPEHVGAITWLNESSAASFYLLKLEGVRIGESDPAPLLTLIVGPSTEGREIGETKKKLADTDLRLRKFWTLLLERAKPITKLFSTISPSGSAWIAAGSGRSGMSLNYVVRKHGSSVELYIYRGPESGEENRAVFDQLYQAKEEIERTFGEPLEWNRPEGKIFCRIRKMLATAGYADDETTWPSTADKMIDAMIRLEKSLRPHLERL